MREFRRVAGGAVLFALVLSACSPGASTQSPSFTSAPSSAPTSATSAAPTTRPTAATLASTLVFGGPPECPERPFCLIGLEDTYGLQFKEFRPLDSGGPITVEALVNDEVQVALLFTSDPTIVAREFVILEDDLRLQRADNLVPVVNAQLIADYPIVGVLLNAVSANLSQDALVELNRQSTEDRTDPADIAASWLESEGLLDQAEPGAGTDAPAITVGKTNFYEQDILSELYAQILEAADFTVGRQDASGTREVVFPALESGDIDVLPEYAASVLEYANGGAGEATADAAETTELLRAALEPRGLTALDAAEAADQNAIVVTQSLADEHGLVKISDLNKPAP